MSEISDRISIARKEIGLSQGELAEKVGLTRPAVSKWEKGSVPENSRMEALAEALGVETAWLAGFGPRLPIRKAHAGDSQEAALQGGALLDWAAAYGVFSLCLGNEEWRHLPAESKIEVLKRMYIANVKDPKNVDGTWVPIMIRGVM